MDGFTGNITLKLIEGVSGRTLRAIRDAAMSSPRGEARRAPAAHRPSGGCATRSTPRRQGGAYMLGLRQLGVVAHGRFTAAASRARSRSRPAASRRT